MTDFAADIHDRKSITGGTVIMDGAVGAKSGVTLSIMKVLFTAASHVTFVSFLEFGDSAQLMYMMMDSQAAIRQLESEDSMTSAKHLDIRSSYSRLCNKRIVKPKYVNFALVKAIY